MEAGLFTLRFVITGMSTKQAAEACNTTETTYKKWEATRIYPIDALDLIRARAKQYSGSVRSLINEENSLATARQELADSFQDSTAKVINFPDE